MIKPIARLLKIQKLRRPLDAHLCQKVLIGPFARDADCSLECSARGIVKATLDWAATQANLGARRRSTAHSHRLTPYPALRLFAVHTDAGSSAPSSAEMDKIADRIVRAKVEPLKHGSICKVPPLARTTRAPAAPAPAPPPPTHPTPTPH